MTLAWGPASAQMLLGDPYQEYIVWFPSDVLKVVTQDLEKRVLSKCSHC